MSLLQEGFPPLQFPESETPGDTVVETAVQATGALGIGMIGMLSVMPDLDFQQGGQAPGGSVGPGSPGGGGLPTNTAISTLSLSLALVPLGLLAVAVFPPFAKYVILDIFLFVRCYCNKSNLVIVLFCPWKRAKGTRCQNPVLFSALTGFCCACSFVLFSFLTEFYSHLYSFHYIFRPRTFPAVGVIFSEPRDVTGTIRKREVRRLFHKVKRATPENFWIGSTRLELPTYGEIKYALENTESRKTDILTKVWNDLNRFQRWIERNMYGRLSGPMKKIVKKIGRIESRIHKSLLCLKPRLKRTFGKLVYPEGQTVKAIKENTNDFIDFDKHEDAEHEHVSFIEDCFIDINRRKFGWRVKIRLKEDEPCDLNIKNPELSTCILSSNQDTGLLNNNNLNHYAQNRQTGEGFRSAAPPDCRYQYICDDGTNQAENNQEEDNLGFEQENSPQATQVQGNPVLENPFQPDTSLEQTKDLLADTLQANPVQVYPTQGNVQQEYEVPTNSYDSTLISNVVNEWYRSFQENPEQEIPAQDNPEPLNPIPSSEVENQKRNLGSEEVFSAPDSFDPYKYYPYSTMQRPLE